VRRVLPSSFLAPTTIKRKQQSNPLKLTTHAIKSHPSTPREKQRKKPPCQEWKILFACFVVMLATWMSCTSVVIELTRGILNILGTHITMSLLIFRLIAILVLHLVLLLMLCLASFMDLTITHMVLVHERTTLCLDALVTSHILIVVIVFRVGMIFLLEGLKLTLSPDTWMVHVFPIMVHIPLVQRERCKRL
jgi:hypothetical protein